MILATLLASRPKSLIHVGAHNGQELGAYLSAVSGEIHLFEPQPGPFRTLKRKASNHPRVKAYQAACGREDKEAEMYISSNRGLSSSILPPKEHRTLHPDITFRKALTVEVRTLDSFNVRGQALVMDTQGTELDVLRGGEETLRQTSIIVSEVNDGEIYEGNATFNSMSSYLDAQGFRLECLKWHNKGYGDAMWKRRS